MVDTALHLEYVHVPLDGLVMTVDKVRYGPSYAHAYKMRSYVL